MIASGRRWQLQEAKARFSEVVTRAQQEGPQVITRHGREAAVLISAEEYARLSKPPSTEKRLIDVLRSSPLVGLSDEEIDAMFPPRTDTGRSFSFDD
jgi:prevent-host-death family protein